MLCHCGILGDRRQVKVSVNGTKKKFLPKIKQLILQYLDFAFAAKILEYQIQDI